MRQKKLIYVILWYFPSFPGGAEKSILEELKNYKNKNCSVFVLCFDENYRKGNFRIGGVRGINYGLKFSRLSSISSFYTLLLNRNYILEKLTLHINKKSKVVTQTLITPIVAEFCIKNNIKYIYYLRDEINLNEFHNYEKGIKRFLKFLKFILEYPAIIFYATKNLKALKNAYKIISNSKFIKTLLKRKYNLNSIVRYPRICYTDLKKGRINKNLQKYITFIRGKSYSKGYDIVLKIAKKLPEFEFMIVGPYKKKFKKKNILFIPFKKDVMEIYKLSRLVIVPSRWNEAFGRVVLEANYLNIPVITSNKGGLPEANKNKNLIIENLEDIDIWVKKIRNIVDKK